MARLKRNGKIYFIDRSLESLIPTADRPLYSTKEAIEKRYNERYDLYKKHADVVVDANAPAEEVAEKISEDFFG